MGSGLHFSLLFYALSFIDKRWGQIRKLKRQPQYKLTPLPKDDETLTRLKENNQVVVQYVDGHGNFGPYPINPNGSVEHIAGICDETGRIFGMMPHPENYIIRTGAPPLYKRELAR